MSRLVTHERPLPRPSRGDEPSAPEPLASRWRRWRLPAAVIALVLVTAVIIGIVQSSMSRGTLDPEGIDAQGARALARLLDDQGVKITPVRTTEAVLEATSPGDTVLVTVPDLLTAGQVNDVVDTGARLVLVAPQTSVEQFAPELDPVRVGPPEVVEPACDLPEARRAGPARLGGLGYEGELSRTHGARCYTVGDSAALVTTASAGGSPVTLIGSGDPLTNEHLDQDGNAALALGLLGHSDHLVWYRPVPESAEGGTVSLTDQLPDWVGAAALQLAVAVALAAAWRARRLGRLVPEQLPVAVRASETTEGRARLYRRGHAREHAAALLREASLRRLDRMVGRRSSTPSPAAVAELAAVVAERTGRPVEQVETVLGGPPPADDAGLVRLADELDTLEAECSARPAGAAPPTRKDSGIP